MDSHLYVKNINDLLERGHLDYGAFIRYVGKNVTQHPFTRLQLSDAYLNRSFQTKLLIVDCDKPYDHVTFEEILFTKTEFMKKDILVPVSVELENETFTVDKPYKSLVVTGTVELIINQPVLNIVNSDRCTVKLTAGSCNVIDHLSIIASDNNFETSNVKINRVFIKSMNVIGRLIYSEPFFTNLINFLRDTEVKTIVFDGYFEEKEDGVRFAEGLPGVDINFV